MIETIAEYFAAIGSPFGALLGQLLEKGMYMPFSTVILMVQPHGGMASLEEALRKAGMEGVPQLRAPFIYGQPGSIEELDCARHGTCQKEVSGPFAVKGFEQGDACIVLAESILFLGRFCTPSASVANMYEDVLAYALRGKNGEILDIVIDGVPAKAYKGVYPLDAWARGELAESLPF